MLPVEAETLCFPHARTILMARTWDRMKDSGEEEPAVRFFVSSHEREQTPACRFAEKVRAHWNIENGTHWRRDVLWREDGNLIRDHKRAHILSSLRQVSNFLLSTEAAAHKLKSVSGRARRNLHKKDAGIQLILTPVRE